MASINHRMSKPLLLMRIFNYQTFNVYTNCFWLIMNYLYIASVSDSLMALEWPWSLLLDCYQSPPYSNDSSRHLFKRISKSITITTKIEIFNFDTRDRIEAFKESRQVYSTLLLQLSVSGGSKYSCDPISSITLSISSFYKIIQWIITILSFPHDQHSESQVLVFNRPSLSFFLLWIITFTLIEYKLSFSLQTPTFTLGHDVHLYKGIYHSSVCLRMDGLWI